MEGQSVTRRSFAVRLGAALPMLGMRRLAGIAAVVAPDGISRTEEAIHNEVTFAASRQRVYHAITDEKQFSVLTGLPATISHDVGGAYSAFGGQITGRNVELLPSERIVLAWRAEDWDHGTYSIARFVLKAHGSGTTLVFDHTGFPKGQADHLASGWKEHYWANLSKYLT
jgi:activator of HSP90 ATPase